MRSLVLFKLVPEPGARQGKKGRIRFQKTKGGQRPVGVRHIGEPRSAFRIPKIAVSPFRGSASIEIAKQIRPVRIAH